MECKRGLGWAHLAPERCRTIGMTTHADPVMSKDVCSTNLGLDEVELYLLVGWGCHSFEMSVSVDLVV